MISLTLAIAAKQILQMTGGSLLTSISREAHALGSAMSTIKF
jgi:hypothetical protein